MSGYNSTPRSAIPSDLATCRLQPPPGKSAPDLGRGKRDIAHSWSTANVSDSPFPCPMHVPAESIRPPEALDRPGIRETGDVGLPLAGSITYTPRAEVPAEVLARVYSRLDRIP